MRKIIFFDIDGTLFAPQVFLDDFFSDLIKEFNLDPASNQKLYKLYEENKKIYGYFLPQEFFKAIITNFPHLEAQKLNKIFWNLDLFKKSMYKDNSNINILKEKAALGIFSKGQEEFQKYKLLALENIFETKFTYIFPNKIDKAKEIFEKYKDCEIYLIDNDLDTLNAIKEQVPELNIILIDRNDRYADNTDVRKINNLDEVNEII